MTMKTIVMDCLKKGVEEPKLFGFISNSFCVYVQDHAHEVFIEIPTEWLYYVTIAGLHASDGEVYFGIVDGERANTFSIVYSQNGCEWRELNTLPNSALNSCMWLFD